MSSIASPSAEFCSLLFTIDRDIDNQRSPAPPGGAPIDHQPTLPLHTTTVEVSKKEML